MKNITSKHGLHNVGSIETVHTVAPYDSFLAVPADNVPCRAVCLLLDMVVTVVAQLSGDHIDKLRQIFIFHLFALRMEVKPDESDIHIT